jgi:rhodanese-related sulfurtransferase
LIEQLQPAELAQRLAGSDAPVVLDVREDWEWQTCAIAGSAHLPMGQIPARLGELDRSRAIVCVCHHGIRSQQVALFLARQGFERLANLSGGIDAWAEDMEPAMARY